MVKELTEKRSPAVSVGLFRLISLKVGIRYQRHRTRCQIIIRIQNPTQPTKLHKSVANRIRWRRELRQMEHPTKIS